MTDTAYSGGSIWWRLLFMILFGLIYSVAEVVLFAIVVIQFGFVLFTDNRNLQLLNFGRSVGVFIYQIIAYLTFNRESRPFPFAEWPRPDDSPSLDSL